MFLVHLYIYICAEHMSSMELLENRACVCSTLIDSGNQLLRAVTLIYTLISNAWVSVAPYPPQHLVLSVFFISFVYWLFHYDLKFYFPNDWDWATVKRLMVHLNIFFGEVPVYSFCLFFYWVVFFFLFMGVLYILQMSLLGDIHYEHHLPLSDLPFQSFLKDVF